MLFIMDAIRKIELNKISNIILVTLLGTVLLTISAKIKIPFYPVPMTMQTFAVLFMGIAFGWKIGVATISLYLFAGIIGWPVFSGTPEKGLGLIYFTGPTMGYLIGFLVAAFLAGYLKPANNFFSKILILLISVLPIYILGIFWLGILIGWDKPLFELGVKPFLLAEFTKILLLSILYTYLTKFKKII
jgi:biotin transport system substrate-specific component